MKKSRKDLNFQATFVSNLATGQRNQDFPQRGAKKLSFTNREGYNLEKEQQEHKGQPKRRNLF